MNTCMNTCISCTKSFCDKKTLHQHKKYCIKLQHFKRQFINNTLRCTYCKTKYSTQENLNTHLTKCVKKNTSKIQEIYERILDKQDLFIL